MVGKQTFTRICSVCFSIFTSFLTRSLYLWNMGLASMSFKDQLTRNQKVCSFYLSSISNKKPKSLACVTLLLANDACAVSFQHRSAKILLVGLWCLQAHVQTICFLLIWQGICLPHIHTLREKYAYNYSPSSYGQIVGPTELFNLNMATILGEGKTLNSNLFYFTSCSTERSCKSI